MSGSAPGSDSGSIRGSHSGSIGGTARASPQGSFKGTDPERARGTRRRKKPSLGVHDGIRRVEGQMHPGWAVEQASNRKRGSHVGRRAWLTRGRTPQARRMHSRADLQGGGQSHLGCTRRQNCMPSRRNPSGTHFYDVGLGRTWLRGLPCKIPRVYEVRGGHNGYICKRPAVQRAFPVGEK
jgi:hypothetical protein